MKLSHDVKNMNIHLVNFYFIYLTIFIHDPQQSWISIDMGPISKLRVLDVKKLVYVYLIILRWATRLIFEFCKKKKFDNFYGFFNHKSAVARDQ